MSASRFHDTARLSDADERTQIIFDSMMKQALLLAVEKLGGTMRLTVDELDRSPIGKRMDLRFDERARVFTFTTRENR